MRFFGLFLDSLDYNRSMSERPVFVKSDKKPYFKRVDCEIEYNAGQAPSQKQKNVEALHAAFHKTYDMPVLEVSTKSEDELGRGLSPFNLKKQIVSLHKDFPVENIFQASKVFERGGPYYDLFGTTPLSAKRDKRLENSGKIVHFKLEDTLYPAYPDILFYNWLYIKALKEYPDLVKKIKDYDAFSDIEFNPKGTNCQAKACAIFRSLQDLGLLDEVNDFEDFKKLFYIEDISEIKNQKKHDPLLEAIANRPTAKKRTVFSIGDKLMHPSVGVGEVMKKDNKSYTIYFRVSGPKTLNKKFVEENCRKI